MEREEQVFAELDAAIAAASPVERAALVIQLAARLAALGAGLATVTPSVSVVENLDVEEGARRLGVSGRYLYRNAKTLPFMMREGGRLLVNSARLDQYISRKTGNGAT
jgi:hypothetical protein